MSSVGVTFANRVLGLRLAPALQIDKAKVVPVFYSHSCQNAYSRQHPFAELCANSEHGDGKDANEFVPNISVAMGSRWYSSNRSASST